MNAELQETRGLARSLFAMLEEYRAVKPARTSQSVTISRAANRMEESILGGLRTACEELADDFLDQEEVKNEIARIEQQTATNRAQVREHHVLAQGAGR
jgi:hypothetical protein